MKKLRRFLPVLILILALIVVLAPARNNSANTALPEQTAGIAATAEPGTTTADAGGELQLLEPSGSGSAESPQESAAGQSSEPEKPAEAELSPAAEPDPDPTPIPEDGSYTTREDVSLYLVTYGHLPPNFVTKAEAEKAGWTGGSLEYVLPGKCIGGDRFGNREGQLPKAKGRIWWECDINTLGKRSRGTERLVYSNDGLIYYTADHYETYTRLY